MMFLSRGARDLTRLDARVSEAWLKEHRRTETRQGLDLVSWVWPFKRNDDETKTPARVVPIYPRSEDRIYREKTATRCAR